MKILELYSGTQGISTAFRNAGHDTMCVELNPIFTKPPYNLKQHTMNILFLTIRYIYDNFGTPDVIWLSPLCTTYSLAASGAGHRMKINGINVAKSEKAIYHDQVLRKAMIIAHHFATMHGTIIYIENPRSGMRHSPVLSQYEDIMGLKRYTVTYCQYELDRPVNKRRMKPTDIWTNLDIDPMFRPACKNGASCHVSAPRGSRTGTQGLKGNLERSMIPRQLCEHIVWISERQQTLFNQ